MSAGDNLEAVDIDVRCASCGIAEVDNFQSKNCDDCDLVKYCSDACQQNHRSQHEAKCKERAAELCDEILFQQPESSHHGDCPICCLPIPLGKNKFATMSCCSKMICEGCIYTDKYRQYDAKGQMRDFQLKCLFCRHTLPKTQQEGLQNLMKRVAASDPLATSLMGSAHSEEGDHERAFKYFTKAAELGDADAHYGLSLMYKEGGGIDKDQVKEIHHLEEASIRGHPYARHNLGCYEENRGRIDRAVKHYIIAANLGCDESLQALKEWYDYNELVSKDDFAAALRAHHAAVKATKSPQRAAASKAYSQITWAK